MPPEHEVRPSSFLLILYSKLHKNTTLFIKKLKKVITKGEKDVRNYAKTQCYGQNQ